MTQSHRNASNRSVLGAILWFPAFLLMFGLFATPASATTASLTDVVILTNGGQLNGQFVRAVGEAVTFHDDVLGDVQLKWAQIKELRTTAKVAVIRQGQRVGKKTPASAIPSGVLKMADQQIVLESDNQTTVATIPVADAAYVVDQASMEKQLRGAPGWLTAWNGAATAGASLIRAAQNSHNIDGAVSLVRTVPTVSWLSSRNRTTFLLTGASGKIDQPAYLSSGGTTVPAQITKTDVYHLGLQRDQYFSSRAYYFGTVQYDHNFSQNLQLQQLYGAGLGLTTIKTPRQTLDLTANIQYVRQTFIESAPGDDKNLVGSTLSASYTAKLTDGIVFNQYVAYLPAFNDGDAYSVLSRNTLTLPAYRNLRVVMGTVNSYLNAVATSEPPSKRNAFQFTFGLSYDIKSSY